MATDALPAPAFKRTAQSIRWLRAHADEQPDLVRLARELGVAPAVARREFRRLVGISPKRFVQELTARRATTLLDRGADVLSASLEAGLSGPGRLHDLLVRVEGVSPGEWKRRGAGAALRWGLGPTPFGPAAVAWTRRGIHRLGWSDEVEVAASTAPRDDPAARILLDQIFAPAAGHDGFALDLVATPFQLAVWRALLGVGRGATTTYGALAESLDHAQGARAVAGAVAANPVAVLIPCHRVLREDGALAGYRWGRARKLGLLCQEETG